MLISRVHLGGGIEYSVAHWHDLRFGLVSTELHSNLVGWRQSLQFDLFTCLFEITSNVVYLIVGSRFFCRLEVTQVNQF